MISDNLTDLIYLDLSSCREITDRGLEYLQQLEKLAYIDFSNCDNITDKGILSLQRKNLTIKR
jgi:F-box and leucine-rich repeat protein 14